jgi:hypothetical protein
MPNSPADVTAGAPNPASYADNGNGTVTDIVTKLMWQQTVPTTTYTWADAIAYCPTLTLGSFSDWRLPSLIELTSIQDLGRSAPTINTTYFPMPSGSNAFWSATPMSSTNARGVDFLTSSAIYWSVTSLHSVRCVR